MRRTFGFSMNSSTTGSAWPGAWGMTLTTPGGEQADHLHLAPFEDVRRLEEEALLGTRRRLPPGGKCIGRSLHRSLRVLARRRGDGRHRFAGERITVRVGGAV